MHLTTRIKVQLAIFSVVALVGLVIVLFGYVKLPAMFGWGRYTVTMELPRSGGLYPSGNVTYRGTQVGKVESVSLADNGKVQATLSLYDGVDIPSNLRAEVHSQSAVGEQYVALLPRDETSPPLRQGSVIAAADTSVPPGIDTILDDTNRGLLAIPHENLKTTIDEGYIAVGGLGPELSRLVKGSVAIAKDARANLDSLTALIDGSAPVLNTQTDTSDSVQAWASHLATVTEQLRDNDTALAGVIDNGGPAAEEARALLDRLQPTLPVILANLVSVGQVAVAYQPAVEQLLVLLPQGVAQLHPGVVPNRNTSLKGGYLDFNLSLNLPPPCTTGYLPAQQRRTPAQVDYPDRPEGDLYCRTPQDGPFNVRGAKNLPCLTKPGKRAPTVDICESDQEYVPLNDGFNWKGDPNATLSGQDVPQLPLGTPRELTPSLPEAAPPPAAPPLAVTEYDPATGSYIGPDGQVYTQSDLAQNASEEKTWQDMLVPGN